MIKYSARHTQGLMNYLLEEINVLVFLDLNMHSCMSANILDVTEKQRKHNQNSPCVQSIELKAVSCIYFYCIS